MQQAASDTFATAPLGHKFVLRKPLAKATANRCAECGEDIRAHSREEVTDAQLLEVLNVQDDGKASIILPGELAVGSYKAALAVCKQSAPCNICVLNCAGQALHSFMPLTRKDFDRLRGENPPRLRDLEWEDSESFDIELQDVIAALAWMRSQVESGRMVVVNCAQGKSRSGTMAVAYLMAKQKLSVVEALARVKAHRPLVEPNPAFVRQLTSFTKALHEQPVPVAREEARLREAFARYTAGSASVSTPPPGGLGVDELRVALINSGEPANDAKGMVDEHASGGARMTCDEFVHAWRASGRKPIVLPGEQS